MKRKWTITEKQCNKRAHSRWIWPISAFWNGLKHQARGIGNPSHKEVRDASSDSTGGYRPSGRAQAQDDRTADCAFYALGSKHKAGYLQPEHIFSTMDTVGPS